MDAKLLFLSERIYKLSFSAHRLLADNILSRKNLRDIVQEVGAFSASFSRVNFTFMANFDD